MSVGGGLRVRSSYHIWHVVTGCYESCVCILSFNFSAAALRVFLTRDRKMEQEMMLGCFGVASVLMQLLCDSQELSRTGKLSINRSLRDPDT